jgi:hypothetical protein
MRSMNKPPSLLSLLLVLALLAIFGFLGARYMLNKHSSATTSQLAIVWPHIETMPAQERAFLVELALTCNVAKREPVRTEVIDCLRSTTAKMQPGAREQLDRLIGQAPQAAARP